MHINIVVYYMYMGAVNVLLLYFRVLARNLSFYVKSYFSLFKVLENGHPVSVVRQISVFPVRIPDSKHEMPAFPNGKAFSRRENIPRGAHTNPQQGSMTI